jgi:hypothetical protein
LSLAVKKSCESASFFLCGGKIVLQASQARKENPGRQGNHQTAFAMEILA